MIRNRVREYVLKYEADNHTRLPAGQLKAVAGLSYPTILNILHNQTTLYDMVAMEKLCRFLEIPIEALFYMDDTDPAEALAQRSPTKQKYTKKQT
jgi:hypothetical protein